MATLGHGNQWRGSGGDTLGRGAWVATLGHGSSGGDTLGRGARVATLGHGNQWRGYHL